MAASVPVATICQFIAVGSYPVKAMIPPPARITSPACATFCSLTTVSEEPDESPGVDGAGQRVLEPVAMPDAEAVAAQLCEQRPPRRADGPLLARRVVDAVGHAGRHAGHLEGHEDRGPAGALDLR